MTFFRSLCRAGGIPSPCTRRMERATRRPKKSKSKAAGEGARATQPGRLFDCVAASLREAAIPLRMTFFCSLCRAGGITLLAQNARSGPPGSSFVHLASVTDARHLHHQLCVVNGVHHAVVAYTNAPLAVSALQLL